jgi:hypothetical protein
MKGTLTVTVHAAYNLKDTATLGKQDPYCKLSIDKTTFKTPVHKDGGRNPVWGQSYLFNLVGAAGEDKIHIAVVEDGAMSDTDIARADIDLKALCSHLGRKKYNCYDRNNFTVMAGEIELTAAFQGTGGPAILSKSAEVAAQEQKASSNTTQTTQQNLEMERMRLQMEQMKMQNQQQQTQYSQPQYNQPMTAQPQFLQPQVIVQQPVKVEVKQVGNAQFQDNWGYCGKCQNLFFNGAGGGRCAVTGGAHHYGGYNYSLAHGNNKPTNAAQEGWRWCNKCHCICFSGLGAGSCAAGGGHDFNGSGQYWGCSEGHTSQSQNGWNWCNKCQTMFFGSMINSTKCPAGGNHNNQGSGNYHLAYVTTNSHQQAQVVQQTVQQVVQQTVSSGNYQSDWRWCKSCQSVFFGGAGGGKCGATGGSHDKSASYDYHVPHSSNPGHKAQENWRWCSKCHCICFGGMGAGSCYAGGGHDFGSSYNYWVGQENHKGTAQDQFNWCCKCMVLHFKGMVSSSRCPATGGQHDGSQSYNYFVYHP